MVCFVVVLNNKCIGGVDGIFQFRKRVFCYLCCKFLARFEVGEVLLC